MSSLKGVWRLSRRKWRDRVAGAGLLAGLVIALVGCGPPTDNVVVDQNGNSIRISDIGPIATSTELNDDQKREALRALGLSDTLIDVMLTVLGG